MKFKGVGYEKGIVYFSLKSIDSILIPEDKKEVILVTIKNRDGYYSIEKKSSLKKLKSVIKRLRKN